MQIQMHLRMNLARPCQMQELILARGRMQLTATQCNTLQHTATHCNTGDCNMNLARPC